MKTKQGEQIIIAQTPARSIPNGPLKPQTRQTEELIELALVALQELENREPGLF